MNPSKSPKRPTKFSKELIGRNITSLRSGPLDPQNFTGKKQVEKHFTCKHGLPFIKQKDNSEIEPKSQRAEPRAMENYSHIQGTSNVFPPWLQNFFGSVTPFSLILNQKFYNSYPLPVLPLYFGCVWGR